MYDETKIFDYELELKVLMDEHFPNFTEQDMPTPTLIAYNLIEETNGNIYLTVISMDKTKSPNSVISVIGSEKSGVEQRLENFQRFTGIELKIAPEELQKCTKRDIIKFEKSLTTIQA